ncbi:hypothetical protein FA048_11330 [Pedobacter polaris]|uniref:Putative auto-transporter adhesin head GIN domain-containing protein n=1 Tax=Pedobacter polaris TaxID=2571273 RepID=A0A4U1CT60_9SPHI|nr:DUF2807 domain-containing protein [Pedobacter polaris]TKC10756.1 hypothetical protein FA048_11330 [Pedobacter polaris]
MKTSIKTLFATGLIALALSTSTVYANNVVSGTTISASAVNIASVKKLVISGNVEVTISQDPRAKVLYTNDGTGNVSVKKVGSSVYIDSKNNAHDAKITIYVDDIYRIEASDNATVFTNSELTLKYLQVFLKDSAKLELNSKTENLYTSIKNTSKLTLKGATDLYKIDMDKSSRIALEKFNSKKTDMTSCDVYVASRN